ncbi:MAG: 4Fe-4S binding protein [Candidatus Bathyarchaeales archaeon]
MKRFKEKILRFQTLRWTSQLCFFILLNAVIFGVAPVPLVLPVLHSAGTPHKTVGDAFAAIQQLLYETVFPWLPLAAFFVFAIFLGRATCSWVCPFGFVQEILSYFKRRQMQVSPRTHQQMIYLKYLILAIVILISSTLALSVVMGVGNSYKNALGEFGNAPFNFLSPADTLFAIVPKMVLDLRYALSEQSINAVIGGISSLSLLFWVRVVILAAVVILAVYIPRAWCRYLCPHGAALAFLNRFSFLGLKREAIKCTKATCRDCVQVCPMKVPILDLPWEKFTDPECIYCLKCVDACSTKAIKPKFP